MKPTYEELELAIAKFVDAEVSFQRKAFCDTLITYGSERPRKWISAFKALQNLIKKQEV